MGKDIPVSYGAADTITEQKECESPRFFWVHWRLPSPAPGLDGEQLLWLPSPVPWGDLRKPSTTPHCLRFPISYTGTQTFAFLLGYQTQKNTSIIQKKKKNEDREIERKKNALLLKGKMDFPPSGLLINSLYPSLFLPQLHLLDQ